MSDPSKRPADTGSARVGTQENRPLHPKNSWTILVIDDEPDVREIMVISLEDAGYKTLSAPDGESGLKLLASHGPQILITDIKMPGMSGLEVLKQARRIRPQTQVIVTTGFADIKKAIAALQHDASDFITKPVDDTTLHLALKRAMERYQNQKELADYTRLLEQT
ncbi:MAG: sigma-54-dependent transcriptional regulator, partial [Desulfotignum sp.]